jgi:hypothetical protein
LIQNESVIPSHLRVEEANEAEPFVGESGSGQRKESLLVGAADLRVTHNDREAFFSSETPSNDFSDSSAMEHKFKVSEDNESEDHVRHAEAEKRKPVLMQVVKCITSSSVKPMEAHINRLKRDLMQPLEV